MEDLNYDSKPLCAGMDFNAIKILAFLMIIFMFLNSDVFIQQIMNRYDQGLVQESCVTQKGQIVQSIMFAVSYILIFILLEHDYI
jgi:hypothetical protein